MIKEKKQTTSKAKNTNIKKKSSVQDLIRKEKYIPQFKTLIDETKKLIEFYIIKAQKNLSFIPEKKRGNLISYTELILNRKF